MRVVILIAIITMAVIVGLGMLWISSAPQAPVSNTQGMDQPQLNAQVATLDVLVARQDIPTGTVLSEAMVDRQPWPRNLVLEGFITADAPNASVIGMVARADFKSREPLIASKLVQKEDASFLAASLGQGMRAVTLAVDSVSGVGGFVFPGDRVDILLTHAIGESDSAAAPSGSAGNGAFGATTAEVVLPDVRVLAVNTRKNAPPAPRGSMVNINPVASPDDAPANVTVEISQQDAKRLRLAEKNGTLSLALRSLQDRGQADAGMVVGLSDITQAPLRKKASGAPARQAKEAPDKVSILRGGIYEGAR